MRKGTHDARSPRAASSKPFDRLEFGRLQPALRLQFAQVDQQQVAGEGRVCWCRANCRRRCRSAAGSATAAARPNQPVDEVIGRRPAVAAAMRARAARSGAAARRWRGAISWLTSGAVRRALRTSSTTLRASSWQVSKTVLTTSASPGSGRAAVEQHPPCAGRQREVASPPPALNSSSSGRTAAPGAGRSARPARATRCRASAARPAPGRWHAASADRRCPGHRAGRRTSSAPSGSQRRRKLHAAGR